MTQLENRDRPLVLTIYGAWVDEDEERDGFEIYEELLVGDWEGL